MQQAGGVAQDPTAINSEHPITMKISWDRVKFPKPLISFHYHFLYQGYNKQLSRYQNYVDMVNKYHHTGNLTFAAIMLKRIDT